MVEIDTNDDDFEKDVVEGSSKVLVIVDFWASWCPPCNILKPVLEKIANSEEYKDKIVVAKLNVEENKIKPMEYNVSSIPAVKMFKDGKIIAEFVGARSESDVKDWIDSKL